MFVWWFTEPLEMSFHFNELIKSCLCNPIRLLKNICIFIIYFSPWKKMPQRQKSGERPNRQTEHRMDSSLVFIHSLTHPCRVSHFAVQYIVLKYLSISLFVDILYITALKVIDTNIKLIFANSKINDQCVNEFGIWYVMVFQRKGKNFVERHWP